MMLTGPINWLALGAALSGAGGTLLLYLGSFAFLQVGTFLIGSETRAKVRKSNQRRRVLQRAGLILLMASFAVQALDVFIGG